MQFGKVKRTKIDDKTGNLQETETNFVDGQVNFPVRESTEERVRVSSHEEAMTVVAAFIREVLDDRSMLDPIVRFEFSKTGDKQGYFYVVKCSTKLVY